MSARGAPKKLLHGLLYGRINGASASSKPIAVQSALDFYEVEEEEDFEDWLNEQHEKYARRRRDALWL